MTTREDYGNAYVCTDCYFAHHYGYREIDREPTDDDLHNWRSGYLRGHDLPNMVETEHGQMVREWFAGESDTPTDREPLARLEDLELADNTCSDHYVGNVVDADGDDVPLPCVHCGSADEDDGQHEFSRSACEGCGSTLGGARYRLSLWKVVP